MQEVEIELEGEARIRPVSSRSKAAGEVLGKSIRERNIVDKKKTLHVGGLTVKLPKPPLPKSFRRGPLQQRCSACQRTWIPLLPSHSRCAFGESLRSCPRGTRVQPRKSGNVSFLRGAELKDHHYDAAELGGAQCCNPEKTLDTAARIAWGGVLTSMSLRSRQQASKQEARERERDRGSGNCPGLLSQARQRDRGNLIRNTMRFAIRCPNSLPFFADAVQYWHRMTGVSYGTKNRRATRVQ